MGRTRYIEINLDGSDTDYYWATTDEKQIPRKMDEGGSRIKDFFLNTYKEDKAAD